MADDRRLQHDSLLEDLRDVHQWQELGSALGVSESKMDDIQLLHGDNTTECQRDILNEWIGANPHCKWGDLVFALQKIGKDRTATNIARKYFGAKFRPSEFEKPVPGKGEKSKRNNDSDDFQTPSCSPPPPHNPVPLNERRSTSPKEEPSPSGRDPVKPSPEEPIPFIPQAEKPPSPPGLPDEILPKPHERTRIHMRRVTPLPRLFVPDYCYFLLPLVVLFLGVFAFSLFRKTRHT